MPDFGIVAWPARVTNEKTTVVIFSNHGEKASPGNSLNRVHYLLNTENLLKLLNISNEVSATRKFLVEHLLVL